MFRLKSASAVAIGVMATAAMAQSSTQLPEVKVVAGKPVVTQERTSTGQRVDVVQLSQAVGYADINIATANGAAVLRQRVKDSAKSVCEQIYKLYPLPPDGKELCFEKAMKAATPQVQAAIDAADKGFRSAQASK
ncbi:MAG TPA: UrcA family protein [Steroidobacteraceae bacterium]|nr:UrcA family protein [Steroidobacteraceae bacterium]